MFSELGYLVPHGDHSKEWKPCYLVRFPASEQTGCLAHSACYSMGNNLSYTVRKAAGS